MDDRDRVVDLWDSAGSGPAPGTPRYLSFVDGDGVGFDARLRLPTVCLKCGTTGDIETLRMRLRIHGDLVSRLAAAAHGGGGHGAVVRPGDKGELHLPFCRSCLARKRRVIHLAIAALLGPIWVLALTFAAAAISSSLTVPVLFAALGAWVAVGLWANVQRLATGVALESVDSDGIVRLRGVHPDAAEAIVAASA